MRTQSRRVIVLGLSLVLTAWSQGHRVTVPPVTDQPGLPRVLLVGDSISIGYTLLVRNQLAGKANVHRIPENGGTSGNGVFQLDNWFKSSDKWDVIHFNFGLHDLKRMSDGKQQVPPELYERYLRLFIERAKKTGAKLIFATTTPVPEGKVNPPRVPADVDLYNSVAKRVMAESGIPIDDLYTAAKPNLSAWQTPVNVHFKPEGYAGLAAEVCRSITAALPH